MEYDFQRASMLKRMMAWLLDLIMIVTLAVGCMWGISTFVNIEPDWNTVSAAIDKYEAQFGGPLSPTASEYEQMTAEQKAQADEISRQINEALFQDQEASHAYAMVINKALIIVSLGFLLSFLLWEFLIPLMFKNGQTLGKKCFGIALMRKDGVKVTPFMMFARAILGKCTVETLLPVMILMTFFSSFGLLLSAGFLIAQIVIPLATRNKTAIHDLMACTVAVDLSSQMIFDSPEEMVEYHKRIHEEIANKADY